MTGKSQMLIICDCTHYFYLIYWLNGILSFGTEQISQKLQFFFFANDHVEKGGNDS